MVVGVGGRGGSVMGGTRASATGARAPPVRLRCRSGPAGPPRTKVTDGVLVRAAKE